MLEQGCLASDARLENISRNDFSKPYVQVDMLVKDIYGDSLDYKLRLGLPPELLASSFGKAKKTADRDDSSSFTDADVARSLLYMIR